MQSKEENENKKQAVSSKTNVQVPDSRPSTSGHSKPTYHKQKLHPFDFNGEDLAEIKKIFPEFRPRRAVTRTSTKVVGLPIVDLKKKLKEKISLEGKPLQKLVQKLDHRNEEKITWSEFLTFLENEGVRREIVNDAQLYGIGVKRLEEGQRVVLKEKERVIEYYIDCLCYIQLKQFRLILALFENNQAKLIENENYQVIQELQFQSDYAIPKEAHNTQAAVSKLRPKSPNFQHELQSNKHSTTIKSKFNNMKKQDTMMLSEYNTQALDDTIDESSIIQFQNPNTSYGNLPQTSHKSILQKQMTVNINTQRRKLVNTSQIKERRSGFDLYKSQLYQSVEKPNIKQHLKNESIQYINQSNDYIQSIQGSPEDPRKKVPKNNTSSKQVGEFAFNYQTAFDNQIKEYPITTQKSASRQAAQRQIQSQNQSRAQIKSQLTRNHPYKNTNQQTTQASTQKQDLSYSMKPRDEKSMTAYDRREILRNKQKKKMFGVLGLTKIEDEEGSSAYLYGKDVQRERPFGLKDLFPNLHQDHDRNKKKFDQLIVHLDKQIKHNEQSLQTRNLQPTLQTTKSIAPKSVMKQRIGRKLTNADDVMSSLENSNAQMGSIQGKSRKNTNQVASTTIISTAHLNKEQDEKNDKIKQQQIELLAKKNKVSNRISSVMTKVVDQSDKLTDLREVNKYYYRMHIPESVMTKQKGNSRIKGFTPDQTHSPGDEDGYPKPEDIAKYVEKMRKAEEKNGLKKVDKQAQNSDNLFEQNRKNKIKHTKEVYSISANYHQGCGILAISLIDKEVKIYKVKQNGSKVQLQDLFSFQSKFVVTCIHIEQYVVNSRPILCLGSPNGDVAIYYIDEPSSDQVGPKDQLKVKEKLHSQFNFFQKGGTKLQTEQSLGGGHPQSASSGYGFYKNRLSKRGLNGGENDDNQTLQSQQLIPHYLQPQQTENELTQIRYIRDIGLIVSSLNGTIKIYDGFDFKEIWKTSNKSRKQIYHSQIISFDVSTKLGLMATGGAEGKLILIDPYAFGIINGIQAHVIDILSTFIYDEQQQIITIGQDRTIHIWDAYRLEKIQTLKDTSVNHTPKFTSAAFDKQHGVLYTGCQALKIWEAKVDSKVEIKALQVETLSKTILKERKMLEVLSDSKAGATGASFVMHGDHKTGKVLVTNSSELVDLVLTEKEDINFLVTIDSENLLRTWSVKTSATTYSYKLPMKKRITASAIDPTYQYLAIGNCIGEVQIINLKSGGVLYNLPHCDDEVTCLQFIQGMSEFWLVGGCWTGKLMMWTNPNEDNNFTVSAKCRIGHKDDILCVDSSSQYIVTGGIDGLVSIWNLFSGILKYAIVLPPPSSGNFMEQIVETEQYEDSLQSDEEESLGDDKSGDGDDLNDREETKGSFLSVPKKQKKKQRRHSYMKQPSFYNDNTAIAPNAAQDKAAQELKKTIVSVIFHPYYPNFVCVLQEGGDIHIIDASNGTVAFEYVFKAKLNSNWALDKENQRILLVGDVGKACLLDCTLVNPLNVSFKKSMAEKLHLVGSNNKLPLPSHHLQSGTSLFSGGSPMKKQSMGQFRWKMVKTWFVAHNIHKMDSSFVVSVKYANHIKVYATGTSKGEVKLWSNLHCECLGVINSPSWDPTDIMKIISDIRRENKQKELQKDEQKMEELRKKIKQSLTAQSQK